MKPKALEDVAIVVLPEKDDVAVARLDSIERSI
jgi:hypothetical protein